MRKTRKSTFAAACSFSFVVAGAFIAVGVSTWEPASAVTPPETYVCTHNGDPYYIVMGSTPCPTDDNTDAGLHASEGDDLVGAPHCIWGRDPGSL